MGFLPTTPDQKYILILRGGQSPFATYAKAWLPALQKALRYLERECRRLENLLPGGTRRWAGRGRLGA